MSNTPQGREDICRLGEEWYNRVIRAQVEGEPDNYGKVCLIDVDTGEYVVDSDSLTANKRMLVEKPGRRIYGIRVGFETMGKRGARGCAFNKLFLTRRD
jgi:hypothetical protein